MDEQTKEKVYDELTKGRGATKSPDIIKCDNDLEVKDGTFYKYQIENIIKIATEHGCNFYVTQMDGKTTWVIH